MQAFVVILSSSDWTENEGNKLNLVSSMLSIPFIVPQILHLISCRRGIPSLCNHDKPNYYRCGLMVILHILYGSFSDKKNTLLDDDFWK